MYAIAPPITNKLEINNHLLSPINLLASLLGLSFLVMPSLSSNFVVSKIESTDFEFASSKTLSQMLLKVSSSVLF